jgi:hypothetical protein
MRNADPDPADQNECGSVQIRIRNRNTGNNKQSPILMKIGPWYNALHQIRTCGPGRLDANRSCLGAVLRIRIWSDEELDILKVIDTVIRMWNNHLDPYLTNDHFCLMVEGFVAGSVPRTNGSGSGRPKTSGSGSATLLLTYIFPQLWSIFHLPRRLHFPPSFISFRVIIS